MQNKNPLFLIDDCFPRAGGWDYDLRGSKVKRITFDSDSGGKVISGTANGYASVIKRKINVQKDGVLTLEALYSIVSGNGFYFSFYGKDGECIRLTQRDGYMYADSVKLFPIEYGNHSICIQLDLDKGCAEILSDGKNSAQCTFMGVCREIDTFCFGYSKADVGEATVGKIVRLYKNYLFNDECYLGTDGKMPVFYDVSVSGNAQCEGIVYNQKRNYRAYSIKADKDAFVMVQKELSQCKGNVCFEIKYLSDNNKAAFTLLGERLPVVTLTDKDHTLNNGENALKSHSENVWQTLRVQADTEIQTAKILLNGKAVCEVPFENDTQIITGFCVEYNAIETDGKLLFADIKAMVLPKEPLDYVPAPIVPKKKDNCNVGILSCSLWRDGSHLSWEGITPFEHDHKPLMGWYDEGSFEASDWENKWMSEHGIDFQLYCWYSSESDKPFKKTPYSYMIHDGYMHSKYSENVKFALLWELANGAQPASSEAFRKYFVPYWLDHFFSDKRYMSIDNKAIMSIFAPRRLIEYFGSAQNVKTELDYLKNQVKKLGYDDLVIMFHGDDFKSDAIYDLGVDAFNAYTWGIEGYKVDYTKERINACMEYKKHPTVPTASVGFNTVGLNGIRNPMASVEDFKEILQYCKDDVLSVYDKNEWYSKLVMLAAWNEYGEGSYICPTTLNGFGYLDAVRSVFTEDTPHTDVVPTENQISRVQVLHEKNRRMLAPNDTLQNDKDFYGVLKRYEFKTQDDLDKWEFRNISKLEIKDGRLFGHSDTVDPHMILKDEEFLPVSLSKVQKARVHIRSYKPTEQPCCIQSSVTSREDKTFTNRYTFDITDPTQIKEYTLLFKHKQGFYLKNQITGFRFDPLYGVGDFELLDIEFLKSSANWDLYVDGKIVTPYYDIVKHEDDYYIPFDTLCGICDIENLFWEWDNELQRFTVKSVNECVFIKDSSVALYNGCEITLEKPLSFVDGIPLLPAKLFCDILGKKLTATKEALNFDN